MNKEPIKQHTSTSSNVLARVDIVKRKKCFPKPFIKSLLGNVWEMRPEITQFRP